MAEVKLITNKLRKEKMEARWLSSISRSVLCNLLKGIEFGKLTLIDNDQVYTFGESDDLEALIYVKEPMFYSRLLVGGSIGAAEAYIEGWWDSPDVTKVIELVAANLDTLDKLEANFRWLTFPFAKITKWFDRNSRKGSQKNIMAHYDLGNELYSRFLDTTMQYSSAIYPDDSMSLYEASLFKMKTVCERLQLSSDDHLLEIGTGWGALAIYAAQNYGCRVTTTTISRQQYTYVQNKIQELGLEDRIQLLNLDYRDLTGQFDKLVSIEMIEAVGHEYLPGYFSTCDRLLKPGGRMVLQSILIDNDRYDSYRNNVDFIQKYIFPGGALPCTSIISKVVQSNTSMNILDVDTFGFDYARTLKDWRHNFNRRWSEIKSYGYDEKFRRLWNYYFHYCEGGFLRQRIDVAHFVLKKAG